MPVLVQRVTLHCFAGPKSDWEEQRAELIEGLLSSSSPSQLAMQEAVSVLLYMAQDDTSSSGGDSPQVSPFTISSLEPSLLCLLAQYCLHGLCCFNGSVKMAGLCVSRQAVSNVWAVQWSSGDVKPVQHLQSSFPILPICTLTALSWHSTALL